MLVGALGLSIIATCIYFGFIQAIMDIKRPTTPRTFTVAPLAGAAHGGHDVQASDPATPLCPDEEESEQVVTVGWVDGVPYTPPAGLVGKHTPAV